MNLLVEIFIFIVVIVPVSLFWHELGHLVGARIVRATHITLTIGIGKPILQRTYKNMTFVVNQLFLFHSLTETSSVKSLTRKNMVIITLMGPISSLILSLLTYSFYMLILPSTVILLTILFNLWLGVINLLPFKINERQSDGYTILQMIKNE